MPWGSFVLGTQLTTIRLGADEGSTTAVGYSISAATAPDIAQLLYGPFNRGLLELDSGQRVVAVGTAPAFPMGPKWRKVVRQVG